MEKITEKGLTIYSLVSKQYLSGLNVSPPDLSGLNVSPPDLSGYYGPTEEEGQNGQPAVVEDSYFAGGFDPSLLVGPQVRLLMFRVSKQSPKNYR